MAQTIRELLVRGAYAHGQVMPFEGADYARKRAAGFEKALRGLTRHAPEVLDFEAGGIALAWSRGLVISASSHEEENRKGFFRRAQKLHEGLTGKTKASLNMNAWSTWLEVLVGEERIVFAKGHDKRRKEE